MVWVPVGPAALARRRCGCTGLALCHPSRRREASAQLTHQLILTSPPWSSAMPPPSRLSFHRLALERKLIGRFEVDRLALDGDVALWCLEQHVAFEVDGQLVVLGVVLNFVLARVVDDADAWLVVRVVERHDMARPGADDALFDLATAALHELVVLLRRRVFAVPEPAQDIGIV